MLKMYYFLILFRGKFFKKMNEIIYIYIYLFQRSSFEIDVFWSGNSQIMLFSSLVDMRTIIRCVATG